MRRPEGWQRVALLTVTLALAGCEDAPTEAVTDDVRFRLLSYDISQPADADVLTLRAELTNDRTTPLVSGGCVRPSLAIDSATATGWAPVRTRQYEELIQCVRAFTVDPGATVPFEATITPDPNVAALFPRGVALRLRVIDETPDRGPVVPLPLLR